jgi:hypothetical protein
MTRGVFNLKIVIISPNNEIKLLLLGSLKKLIKLLLFFIINIIKHFFTLQNYFQIFNNILIVYRTILFYFIYLYRLINKSYKFYLLFKKYEKYMIFSNKILNVIELIYTIYLVYKEPYSSFLTLLKIILYNHNLRFIKTCIRIVILFTEIIPLYQKIFNVISLPFYFFKKILLIKQKYTMVKNINLSSITSA